MHNVVAWKVFEASKPNYWLYCAVGWGKLNRALIVHFIKLHAHLSRYPGGLPVCRNFP